MQEKVGVFASFFFIFYYNISKIAKITSIKNSRNQVYKKYLIKDRRINILRDNNYIVKMFM